MFNGKININDQKVVLINASQNRNGNTSKMGKKLLAGINYEQVNLVDYKIYQINQSFPDDQFEEVLDKMKIADTVILGTPQYWHQMSGFLKTLIERIGQYPDQNALRGTNVALIMQGSFPMDGVKETDRILKRFCAMGGMNYIGGAGNSIGVTKLRRKLGL